MPLQEKLLRDFVACRACPKFNKAIKAATASSSPEDLPFEQLLQILQSLPLTEYSGSFEAACRGLLDAMRAGDDQNIIQALTGELCNQVPSDWGMTSGTTGSSKYFPLTLLHIDKSLKATGRPALEMQLIKFPLQPYQAPTYGTSSDSTGVSDSCGDAQQPEWRHRTLSVGLAGPCEQLPGGQLVGSISSVFMNRYSKLGVVLDRDMEGRDMTTRPVSLMYKMAQPGVEAGPRYYALWLAAAADPGLHRVTFFSDLFAGNMLTAIGVLQHHWQDIVEDLKAGEMLPQHAVGLPAGAVECINESLAQQSPAVLAASAHHIQQAMAAHQAAEAAGNPQPLLGLLMPNLHAVLVVVTGSHGKFWPNLKALIPAHVPVCTPWHAGTEGLYGISKQLVEPGPWDTSTSPVDQQFVIMPFGNAFFEFLPVSSESGPDDGSSSSSSLASASVAARGAPVVAACRATLCDVQQLQPNAEQQQQQQQQQQQPVQPQQQQQQQQAVTMDALQAGQEYELVISTYVGLTRYRIGDVVRVNSFMPFDTSTCLAAQADADPANVVQLPVVSFRGRVGVVLNLVWEKYDEGQLLQAIRDTVHALLELEQLQQQQAAGVRSSSFPGLAEFTVFENHEDESNKHYAFFWELAGATPAAVRPPSPAAAANGNSSPSQGPTSAAAGAGAGCAPAAAGVSQESLVHWAAVLNEHLAKQNAVYAGLVSVGQVAPAVIHLVQPGSFKALKEKQVAANGISPSQFKMPTVVAPDSWHVSFLKAQSVTV